MNNQDQLSAVAIGCIVTGFLLVFLFVFMSGRWYERGNNVIITPVSMGSK